MTGSIETAASLGSGVTAQLAGQGSIGGPAEAAIGVANRALDEVLRQLQEKYTLWQQRLDAHVDQVGALPLCPPAVGGCILLGAMHLAGRQHCGVPRADSPPSKHSNLPLHFSGSGMREYSCARLLLWWLTRRLLLPFVW